jgi:hypothetical protein
MTKLGVVAHALIPATQEDHGLRTQGVKEITENSLKRAQADAPHRKSSVL